MSYLHNAPYDMCILFLVDPHLGSCVAMRIALFGNQVSPISAQVSY
uniref:Uncharacterized protein n=1 Tax=Arundo donax TaxID=35708 RepID=A0A0A8ZEY1_ARUDO